ncbi:hypothetical protein L873DRAFT_1811063 [Choiromyces venosus 120613-1]|uniref:Uncharacterized protein n=1 Tax=Choiromyces venosus 120613-1 TaxID=1336337 RepID=A0A3N4JJV0_9PEZI|nr:hypothetical protein L873DRAFT_1811063 [Choiromyces venosus 120613-1]
MHLPKLANGWVQNNVGSSRNSSTKEKRSKKLENLKHSNLVDHFPKRAVSRSNSVIAPNTAPATNSPIAKKIYAKVEREIIYYHIGLKKILLLLLLLLLLLHFDYRMDSEDDGELVVRKPRQLSKG